MTRKARIDTQDAPYHVILLGIGPKEVLQLDYGQSDIFLNGFGELISESETD